MSITLKHKYALLKRVRANPEISDAGKVLFEYLLIQCHNVKTLKCHPGGETIAKALGWELRKVRRVLAHLKRTGALGWRSGRTGWSNEYDFPGLWTGVTERNATEQVASNTPAGVQNLTSTDVKIDTHPVSNLTPQHLIEHLKEHCPSMEGRANALPSLKGFDSPERRGGRGLSNGSKPLVPIDKQIYVQDESPQRKAWEAYGRKHGRTYPKDRSGGWRFPTEWPPGFEQAA